MKVLVTGAGGQLGREFVLLLEQSGIEAIALTRGELELSGDAGVIAGCIESYRADWVVNCAAYTQVDKAESEPDMAFAINRDAAAAIAAGVKRSGGRMLHVSTDFVFAGDKGSPYKEEDAAAPLGIYGQSKYEGEQAVLKELPDAGILRTAWVYGVHGNNFVKTILRVAGEREELRVVDDQIGTPSWTRDIATAMLALIRNNISGIYHFTNEGVASWYDFALAIVEMGAEAGFEIKAKAVHPIPTVDYPTPAQRPSYSVLSKTRIRPLLPSTIPHWRSSLTNMVKELK